MERGKIKSTRKREQSTVKVNGSMYVWRLVGTAAGRRGPGRRVVEEWNRISAEFRGTDVGTAQGSHSVAAARQGYHYQGLLRRPPTALQKDRVAPSQRPRSVVDPAPPVAAA